VVVSPSLGRLDRVACWFCDATAEIFVPTGAQFRLPDGLSVSVNGKDRYVCPSCVRAKALHEDETPRGVA
jgi:hypothetical protein